MLTNNIMVNTHSDFLHMVESVAEIKKRKARMEQIKKGQSTIRKGAKHKSRRAKQRSEKKNEAKRGWEASHTPTLMPQSHQTFRPVPAMKLLEIMFTNRCRSTTFHIITAGNVDGWCLKWPV